MTLHLFMRLLKHFGSINGMKMFAQSGWNVRPIVFDFDWSQNGYKPTIEDIYEMILGTPNDNESDAFLKDIKSISSWTVDRLQSNSLLKNMMQENQAEYGEFIELTLRKIYGATEVMKNDINKISYQPDNFTSYFHPSMLLLNHSCDPNIMMQLMDNGKVAWIVIRPIPANGQIFINYTSPYYAEFHPGPCDWRKFCQPCIGKWREQIDFELVKQMVPMLSFSPDIVLGIREFEGLKAGVAGFEMVCRDLNTILPKNGSKPTHLMQAVIPLVKLMFNMKFAACPFIPIQLALYAFHERKRNGGKYLYFK